MTAALAPIAPIGPRVRALRSLRALITALSRSARAIEWRTGSTNAQLFLLRELAVAGTLSVGELAARASTRQGTVSTVVSRLVRLGLVQKTRSATDSRRAELSLTPRGRALLRRAPTPPTTALIDALDSLSDREARSLAAGLKSLVTALGLSPDDAPLLFEDVTHRH